MRDFWKITSSKPLKEELNFKNVRLPLLPFKPPQEQQRKREPCKLTNSTGHFMAHPTNMKCLKIRIMKIDILDGCYI